MEIISRVVLGLMIPRISLTAALLILFGYAALSPASRRRLDRVSFRLLVYALVANLVYGVTFLIGTISARPGPRWTCDLLAFFTNLSLMFSAGMFFCMALNLPLVLAYNVNGQKMEKSYIFGTAFTVWVLLASAGEVCAFLVVGYSIAHELDKRYFHTDSRLNVTSTSRDSPTPGFTIQMFRNIILRIGLYPLVSCLLNISTSVLDLYVMMHPEAELSWRLNLSAFAIYSARPLIYGLLAATDPSFLRALQALRHPESAAQSETQARHAHLSAQCLSTVIEMPEEEEEEEKEVDFAAGFDKDVGREDPTSSVSGLEDMKEQPIDEEHLPNPQIEISIITLPIQQASIDLVCYI
ncbi:hypothetical protein B0H19DRAFT_1277437 [Mycena capillaripes]|nr:hypothetical protein B0H19DRAFT_1277437 [Mycena capillaripes]